MDQRILDLPVMFKVGKTGCIAQTPVVKISTKEGIFKGRFTSSEEFDRNDITEFTIHTIDDFFNQVQNIGFGFDDNDFDLDSDIQGLTYRGMEEIVLG